MNPLIALVIAAIVILILTNDDHYDGGAMPRYA